MLSYCIRSIKMVAYNVTYNVTYNGKYSKTWCKPTGAKFVRVVRLS